MILGNKEVVWMFNTSSGIPVVVMTRVILLWQPLDTKSNDHTSNKSLRQISSGKFTRELDKEPLLN